MRPGGLLLKDLHVPEIYTDVDEQAKRDALTQLHGLPDQGEN